MRQHYFRLGFHLREFDKCKYYFCFGYSCLADFASVNLGMDASAVSRCISVFEKFCKWNDYHPTMFMQEEYEDFSYSQLVEMVSIKDDDLLRRIKPDMSVREIREFKKRKNVSRENEDVSQIATSQKKFFDYNRALELKGAARSSYIKSLDSIDSIALYVYDRSGNPILEVHNLWFDVLEVVKTSETHRIVLRM